MSSAKILKRRVKSIANTKQITKAMELVAASKLKKVQQTVRNSKPYADLSYRLIHRIAGSSDVGQHPYFVSPEETNTSLMIVFASDRGLAGSFLGGIGNEVLRIAEESKQQFDVIVVGKRAASIFARTKNFQVISVYEKVSDVPTPSDLLPISSYVNESIVAKRYASIYVAYQEFITTSRTQPTAKRLFPITIEQDSTQAADSIVFDFEPSSDDILEVASRLYLDSQLYQARLESAASEYGLRMIAMHSASDNASDLITDLTLELNTTRQTAVTNQMAELSGALAAL